MLGIGSLAVTFDTLPDKIFPTMFDIPDRPAPIDSPIDDNAEAGPEVESDRVMLSTAVVAESNNPILNS